MPEPVPHDLIATAPPTARFGKFVRIQKLGSGAMGEVWKAWDTALNRWVALKFLKGGDDEEMERFKREAQLAGMLNHPNIAAVYDVGSDQGRPFIAMQYIDGRTLRAFPRGDRRALVALVRDAALAVQFAHDRGVVHRDLKPENLMVDAASRRVFVMDFGLARSVEGGHSVSGTVVGTPNYMPPEQARGERADAQSDIYSLGATLYELLTDRVPFRGSSIFETLKKLQDEDPPPPRRVDPKIDADLDTIVLKCLEKDRERRYRSAAELAADLDRWMAGEPVAARAISGAERVWRRVKRNRALSIATFAALVIGLGALIAIIVQRERSNAALELQKQKTASDLEQQRQKAALDLLEKERERLAGEERLKKLTGLWMRILERKRDLRTLEVPAAAARPALADAVAAVEAFAEAHPAMPQAWYLKGRGWMYLDEPEKAEAAARKCVEIEPAFAPGWRLLGMALIHQSQLQWITMTETPEKAARGRDELVQEGVAAIGRGAYAEDESLRWGLPPSSEDDVMRVVAQALELAFGRRRGREALDVLEEAAEQRKAADYAVWRALLGPDTDRRAWFDKAIAWAPGDSFALFYRGLIRQWSQDPKGSIEDFTRAITIRPDYHTVYLSRGHSRKDTGDPKGAIEDYTKAVEIRPDFAEAWIARGVLKRAQGDLPGALADFDRSVSLRKDHLAYFNRALTRLAAQNPAGAIEDLDRAIAQKQDVVDAWYMRATAKAKLGDAKGAEADYGKTIELKPDLALAWFHRGNQRRDLGRLDDAVADFTKTIELQATMPEAWANRGLVKETLGDVAGAAADLEQALKIAPAAWPYRKAAEGWLKRVKGK